MRIFALILTLCWSLLLYATDFSIRSSTQEGKPVFYLEIGAFTQHEKAAEIQTKLNTLADYPTRIESSKDKSYYTVQVGPIKEYALAYSLQKTIANDNDKAPLAPSPRNKSVVPSIPSEKLWNLRNADIRAVIAEVSNVTGKNFLIDPRVQGKVSIVSSTPMSNKELYQVFLSVLQVSGYAAVPTGHVIKIVPNIDAKTLSPDRINLYNHIAEGDELMVEVIPVKYVPAEQLVPVLRPLMPPWSSISAYSPSNMLILSGRANNIRQIADIIKQVDNSSANGIDMVPLKHALAMDVANTLKDLVKAQPGATLQTQTTIAADDRSNSILISGSKTERIKLRLLITQLDKPSYEGNNSTTRVVYLNYLRAEDLVPILAGIAQANFSGTVGTTIGTVSTPVLDSTNPASNFAAGTSATQTAAPPPPASTNPAATPNTMAANTQNEGNTKPTVQIIGEPNTNSIIINGPTVLIRILKSVISQLDIKPAQLLIEALVAEINESDLVSLGIEWGSINQNTLNPETFRPGFAILNSKASLNQFQAQIYALARQKRANILSTPSVVVLDNRQAKILIGKQVSVATTTYPNNANGTTPASPYTTFDRVNVALHLYVRPQITRGRGIQMQIDQGNDTLDNPNVIDPGTNPTFNISAIVTSVHVESGDIIVLGGLAQDSLGNENNGVPILGDIPGVGRLFQHNIATRDKKVLMVFIRPHILRTEQDALEVTGSKYDHVRADQLNYLRRQEGYDVRDEATLSPPLATRTIPRPFATPPTTQTVEVMK